MKTVMKVENPGDVEFTMTITMQLKHWRELAQQLSSHYPSWELNDAISYMVKEAATQFRYEPESDRNG